MNVEIDRESPVPPSHQLAQAVRYRIAVGALGPGDELPSLREAAAALGIHYHTVRKAYKELEADGLVRSAPGKGTTVAAPHRGRALGAGLRGFVERVTREAWQQHSLRPDELTRLIQHFASAAASDERARPPRPWFFVECNRSQANDYAAQLQEATGAPVEPWLLDQDEPPAGRLVATYFHYNDLRECWPHRFREMSFVTVELDPGLRSRVADAAPEGEEEGEEGKVVRLRLCEVDEGRAHNVLPDLGQLLPAERFSVERLVVDDPGRALADDEPSPVLFAPRLWARLSEEERADDRSQLLRYVIREEDLARLAMSAPDSDTDESRRPVGSSARPISGKRGG